MFKKNKIQYFIFCFVFVLCMMTSTFAAVSGGGGGGSNSSGASGGGGGSNYSGASGGGGGSNYSGASGGGGGSNYSGASGGGGGSNYSGASGGGGGSIYRPSSGSAGGGSGEEGSYNSGNSRYSDEYFENNGWTVVSRSNKCVLLCDDKYDDYMVFSFNGGYIGHQYLNWYVENVWDGSEDFDYNKFINYVNRNERNLDRAFGSRLYFDGSAEDLESGNFVDADIEDGEDDFEDDFDEEYIYNSRKNGSAGGGNVGPGVVNNSSAGSSSNNTNNIDTYGKIIASNNSKWVKNQDGTYSLLYVDSVSNQQFVANNGFYTLLDIANGFKVNTYYFDNKGIMVTTPFTTSDGKSIYFASTGEVIR